MFLEALLHRQQTACRRYKFASKSLAFLISSTLALPPKFPIQKPEDTTHSPTNMKLSSIVAALITVAPLATLAMPSPNEDSGLVKREKCTVPINFGLDQDGTCVDTTKKNPCPNGILVTGHCGGGNSNICCIPTRCGIGIP